MRGVASPQLVGGAPGGDGASRDHDRGVTIPDVLQGERQGLRVLEVEGDAVGGGLCCVRRRVALPYGSWAAPVRGGWSRGGARSDWTSSTLSTSPDSHHPTAGLRAPRNPALAGRVL